MTVVRIDRARSPSTHGSVCIMYFVEYQARHTCVAKRSRGNTYDSLRPYKSMLLRPGGPLQPARTNGSTRSSCLRCPKGTPTSRPCHPAEWVTATDSDGQRQIVRGNTGAREGQGSSAGSVFTECNTNHGIAFKLLQVELWRFGKTCGVKGCDPSRE